MYTAAERAFSSGMDYRLHYRQLYASCAAVEHHYASLLITMHTILVY